MCWCTASKFNCRFKWFLHWFFSLVEVSGHALLTNKLLSWYNFYFKCLQYEFYDILHSTCLSWNYLENVVTFGISISFCQKSLFLLCINQCSTMNFNSCLIFLRRMRMNDDRWKKDFYNVQCLKQINDLKLLVQMFLSFYLYIGIGFTLRRLKTKINQT